MCIYTYIDICIYIRICSYIVFLHTIRSLEIQYVVYKDVYSSHASALPYSGLAFDSRDPVINNTVVTVGAFPPGLEHNCSVKELTWFSSRKACPCCKRSRGRVPLQEALSLTTLQIPAYNSYSAMSNHTWVLGERKRLWHLNWFTACYTQNTPIIN